MKRLLIASFAALASVDAAEEKADRYTAPQVSANDARMDTGMQENLVTLDDDQSVHLQIDFATYGKTKSDDAFQGGWWIQNYAQFESPTEPGKWHSVECSAKFNQNGGTATDTRVQGYVGKFDSAGSVLPGDPKIDDKELTLDNTLLWEKVEAEGKYESYYTSSKNQQTHQYCSTVVTLFASVDGTPDPMNDLYWQWRKEDFGDLQGGIGFRLWSGQELVRWGHTSSSYSLWGWLDLIEPVPKPTPPPPGPKPDPNKPDDTPTDPKTDDKSDKVTANTETEESDEMMWIIIGAAVVVVLLIAAVLYWFCYCRKSDQTKITWFGKEKGDGPPVTIGKRSAAGIEMQTSPKNTPTRD